MRIRTFPFVKLYTRHPCCNLCVHTHFRLINIHHTCNSNTTDFYMINILQIRVAYYNTLKRNKSHSVVSYFSFHMFLNVCINHHNFSVLKFISSVSFSFMKIKFGLIPFLNVTQWKLGPLKLFYFVNFSLSINLLLLFFSCLFIHCIYWRLNWEKN